MCLSNSEEVGHPSPVVSQQASAKEKHHQSLCHTPVSSYDGRPAKCGVRFCLALKATMLYACAARGINKADKLKGPRLQEVLAACGLAFGGSFAARMNIRLSHQLRRWAREAEGLDVPGLGWQGPEDAQDYLRSKGHRDWWDALGVDGNMADLMNTLVLGDGARPTRPVRGKFMREHFLYRLMLTLS